MEILGVFRSPRETSGAREIYIILTKKCTLSLDIPKCLILMD